MIRSAKPPLEDAKKGVWTWRHNEVPPGTKWKGFLAGPPTGTYLHFENRQSYPCHEMISERVLVCKRCLLNNAWEWRGYVPYYDEEYVRRFVVVSKDYYESICEIKHLAPITIFRGKEKTDSVVVRYEAWRTTPIPHAKDREQEVDLVNFLIRVLWKDEALLRFHCRSPETDEARKEGLPERVLDGIEVGEEAAREIIMQREKKKSNRLKELEERNKRFLEKTVAEHSNGKPTKQAPE